MIICLIILAPVLTFTQDSEAALARKAIARTKTHVFELKKEEREQTAHLKRLKKAKVDTKTKSPNIPEIKWAQITFPSSDKRTSEITAAETKLSETKDEIAQYASTFYYGEIDFPLGVGDFGKLRARARVMKVIDSKTMLIQAEFWRHIPFPLNFVREKMPLIIKNVSTKGAVEDSDFELPQIFEVIDKVKYKTEADSNSESDRVYVLEAVDTKKIENRFNKR